jgi:hypothetical protein
MDIDIKRSLDIFNRNKKATKLIMFTVEFGLSKSERAVPLVPDYLIERKRISSHPVLILDIHWLRCD